MPMSIMIIDEVAILQKRTHLCKIRRRRCTALSIVNKLELLLKKHGNQKSEKTITLITRFTNGAIMPSFLSALRIDVWRFVFLMIAPCRLRAHIINWSQKIFFRSADKFQPIKNTWIGMEFLTTAIILFYTEDDFFNVVCQRW